MNVGSGMPCFDLMSRTLARGDAVLCCCISLADGFDVRTKTKSVYSFKSTLNNYSKNDYSHS